MFGALFGPLLTVWLLKCLPVKIINAWFCWSATGTLLRDSVLAIIPAPLIVCILLTTRAEPEPQMGFWPFFNGLPPR